MNDSWKRSFEFDDNFGTWMAANPPWIGFDVVIVNRENQMNTKHRIKDRTGIDWTKEIYNALRPCECSKRLGWMSIVRINTWGPRSETYINILIAHDDKFALVYRPGEVKISD